MVSEDFDFGWEDKTNSTLRALREAADRWATGGRDALAPAYATAVLMEILARPQRGRWWMPSWPLRFFDAERPAPPAFAASCRALADRTEGEYEDLAQSMEAAVGAAADLWAMGDPERPDTRTVLFGLLELLWAHGVAPRPPSKAYPRGV